MSSLSEASPSVAELDAPVLRTDFASRRPETRTQHSVASDRLATSCYGSPTRVELSSTEPSPRVPQRLDGAAEVPGLATSREVNSSATDCQDLATDVPETQSTALSTPGAKVKEVEGEHDIRQQLIKIQNERERLTRIHKRERMEANLQQRLARSKETTVS